MCSPFCYAPSGYLFCKISFLQTGFSDRVYISILYKWVAPKGHTLSSSFLQTGYPYGVYIGVSFFCYRNYHFINHIHSYWYAPSGLPVCRKKDIDKFLMPRRGYPILQTNYPQRLHAFKSRSFSQMCPIGATLVPNLINREKCIYHHNLSHSLLTCLYILPWKSSSDDVLSGQ